MRNTLIDNLQQNPFVLAPMAGITDSVFRSQMRSLGCGIVITELVSATGIEYQSRKTLELMDFSQDQRPVGIQLFGEDPQVLARGAEVVEARGADFVDLNFGCPVPKVVKKGGGSAMLKDLSKVAAVFSAVKKATRLPVTVKIRTGWDEGTRNAVEVAKIAYEEGLTWVAIHGRTRAAGYSGVADWNYIADVKSRSKIPILGNGDIATPEQAVNRLLQSKCDGVLIGRGCLKNPWIFKQALEIHRNGQRKADLSMSFAHLFTGMHAAYRGAGVSERIIALQIKKFAAWYSAGYPGASQFRKNIFQADGVENALLMTLNYFERLKETEQIDTSHEPFLMGGHG